MFEYSRDPRPRDGVLTIAQDEAQALYDFVGYLGRHAFDTFRDDVPGFRGKSPDMLRHLGRMRDLLENVMDYPTLDEELCWDEPQPLATDEVHGLLLTEVGNRSGIRFLEIAVYWNDEHRSFGTLQLAVDDEAGETCGLFEVEDLADEQVNCGPGWSQSGADLGETIRIFINAFPMQQLEARNEDCINEMLASKVA
ncbi:MULTISPECIES: hypothetical protein [unclassified Rhizobium]|uniref:hypothetical protein n=1 Tax=unclassified Rhizobium TaxID=2613769 RepID=UPI00160EDAC3|nr:MULTISPECIES: hypothetical protein [unclassified Rhizobium]MBB3290514.1 hypothetical protein [Rhizobium sp. BK252]MBB3405168.1 hypothetical protein [Rhizobium sp. BK289]MBB3417841.1 hypothetical protein [Rhizobium sp. BK284]MBB3485720.1 hypothetical protein [Rhizobium sp. BK347]